VFYVDFLLSLKYRIRAYIRTKKPNEHTKIVKYIISLSADIPEVKEIMDIIIQDTNAAFQDAQNRTPYSP
jgi:hypothetical protein